MFELPEYKTVKDNVHGYIQIPRIFFEKIIDTTQFQRLRNVEQTGMRMVYPSARHDRFAHSLGVLHLGSKAVDALLDNFSKDIYWNIFSNDQRFVFWAKNKVLFLLACLLHDVGHAPFSHSLEAFFMEEGSNSRKKIEDSLGKYFNSTETNKIIQRAAQHEIVSALLVLESYRDQIKDILTYFKDKKYPKPEARFLLEHQTRFPTVDDSTLDDDLKFIARMIMGLEYIEFGPTYQIRNCFISLLNGNNFDVDKLDYIIRDSKMSGIDNIEIDVERLLKSITIITKTVYVGYKFDGTPPHSKFDKEFILKLTCNEQNEVILEGTFDGNIALGDKGSATLHGGSCLDEMIGEILVCNRAYFTSESYICQNNMLPAVEQEKKMLNNFKNPVAVALKNAKICSDSDFYFQFENSRIELVSLRGEAKIKCDNLSIKSAYFDGSINGKIDMEVLGDHLTPQNLEPSANAFHGFAIGFNKQSLNIIQNVVSARNYLYLWIYAHHKVVYYANFLIVELLRCAVSILNYKKQNKKIVSDYISYECIRETSDADITLLLKEAWKTYTEMNEKAKGKYKSFVALYEEFISRRYKRSLYKSLPEYDLLFQEFTPKEKIAIRKKLDDVTEHSSLELDSKLIVRPKTKYGFWNPERNRELFDDLGVSSLMWVDASYKESNFDAENVYLRFSENEVVNFERIPLLYSKSAAAENKNYFYMYYQVKNMNMEFDKNRMQKKLIDYFKSNLQ